MPKQEIDWDDEDAVRAARGDNPDEETPNKEDDDNGLQEEGQEQESDAKKEVDDEKSEKSEKAKGEGDEKKEPMIPKSRYDSKAAENRELKERLDRIERENREKARRQEQTDNKSNLETEIDDLEGQYLKAVGEDELDKAKELRKQIRAKERELFQSEMSESSQETSAATREQVRLDLTIDHIEKEYPAFNPDSDDYDDALVAKVQELRAGFAATGQYTPTEALLKAIDIYMPKADVKDIKDAASDKKVDAERNKQALKKSVDASNKQPPDASGLGEDADALGKKEDLNIDKLTYEDIEKLPAATLKRLRGDFAA